MDLKIKVVDGKIYNFGEKLCLNGINIVLSKEFVKSNENIMFIFDADVTHYRCNNPKLWENTIKANNGNLVFEKDFVSPASGKTIFECYLTMPKSFLPLTQKESELFDAIIQAEKLYPKGTKFYPLHLRKEQKTFNLNKCVSNGMFKVEDGCIIVNTEYNLNDEAVPVVYNVNTKEWAEIREDKPNQNATKELPKLEYYLYKLLSTPIWEEVYNIDRKTFNYKLLSCIAEDVNSKYKDVERIPYVLTEAGSSDVSPTDILFVCKEACNEAEKILGKEYLKSLFNY